jgi:hypothetical protein
LSRLIQETRKPHTTASRRLGRIIANIIHLLQARRRDRSLTRSGDLSRRSPTLLSLLHMRRQGHRKSAK